MLGGLKRQERRPVLDGVLPRGVQLDAFGAAPWSFDDQLANGHSLLGPRKSAISAGLPTLGSVLLFIVSPTGSQVLTTIIDTEYRHLLGIHRIGDGHSATKRNGAQAWANVIAWCPAMWESGKPFTVLDDAFVKRPAISPDASCII